MHFCARLEGLEKTGLITHRAGQQKNRLVASIEAGY